MELADKGREGVRGGSELDTSAAFLLGSSRVRRGSGRPDACGGGREWRGVGGIEAALLFFAGGP